MFIHRSLHQRDFPGGSDGKASAYNAGDLGSIPGPGRSPGEGNGNPLQYSCLENPMVGGGWQATVHGVIKSQTRLSDFLSYIRDKQSLYPKHARHWMKPHTVWCSASDDKDASGCSLPVLLPVLLHHPCAAVTSLIFAFFWIILCVAALLEEKDLGASYGTILEHLLSFYVF